MNSNPRKLTVIIEVEFEDWDGQVTPIDFVNALEQRASMLAVIATRGQLPTVVASIEEVKGGKPCERS